MVIVVEWVGIVFEKVEDCIRGSVSFFVCSVDCYIMW
jgi:hypothetical protein